MCFLLSAKKYTKQSKHLKQTEVKSRRRKENTFKILLNETVGEKERELAEGRRNVRKLKSIICSKIKKKRNWRK